MTSAPVRMNGRFEVNPTIPRMSLEERSMADLTDPVFWQRQLDTFIQGFLPLYFYRKIADLLSKRKGEGGTRGTAAHGRPGRGRVP